MKVFVYYNRREKLWSIKALDGPERGRVLAHAYKVLLRDCTFKVSEAGRQRALRERRNSVHSGVVGTLDGFAGFATQAGERRVQYRGLWDDTDREYERYAKRHGETVRYDPYEASTYVTADVGEPVHEAEMVYLGERVIIFDPCLATEPVTTDE